MLTHSLSTPWDKVSCVRVCGHFYQLPCKERGKCETFSFCLFNISFDFLPINKFCSLTIETALFNNALVWFHGRYAGKKHLKTTCQTIMLTSESIKTLLQKKVMGNYPPLYTASFIFPTAFSFRDWPAAPLHLLILSHHELSGRPHLIWEWDLQVSSLTSFILSLVLQWKCRTPPSCSSLLFAPCFPTSLSGKLGKASSQQICDQGQEHFFSNNSLYNSRSRPLCSQCSEWVWKL